MEPSQSSVSHRNQRHPLTVLFVILLAPMVATALAVFGVWLVLPSHTITRHAALTHFVLSGIFAQATLLATWNALGEGSHFVRPMTSLLCLGLIWLAGVMSLTWLIPFFNEMAAAGFAMFVQWIVIQIPLWILRIRFGWQLGFLDQHHEPGQPRDVQFGIKHLILWTTMVAIALAIGKALVQREVMGSRDFLGFGIFLIFNCLFSWPTTFGALADRWMPACVGSAFFITAAVSLAEQFVFQAVDKRNASEPNIFFLLNGIQFLWICGTVFIVRRFGYRLVRAW